MSVTTNSVLTGETSVGIVATNAVEWVVQLRAALTVAWRHCALIARAELNRIMGPFDDN